MIFIRLLFFTGIALLAAGGALIGNYHEPNSVNTGRELVEAGYIVVALTFGTIVAFQGWLWTKRSQLTSPSITVSQHPSNSPFSLLQNAMLTVYCTQQILRGTTLAIPFLIIRITYAFLAVFRYTDQRWNDLSGSVGIFVAMALIMEYAVVCLYLGVGYMIPSVKSPKKAESTTAGDGEADYGEAEGRQGR